MMDTKLHNKVPWLIAYYTHPSKHVPIPSFQPVKKKREEETSVKTLRELLVTTTNAIANPSLATAYNYNNPRGGKYSRGEFLAFSHPKRLK